MFVLVWNAITLACLCCVYAWGVSAWPALHRRRTFAVCAIAGIWTTPTLTHYASIRWHAMEMPAMVATMTVIALAMTGPGLGLVFLVSWLLRRRQRTSRSGDGAGADGAGAMTRRQWIEATSGLILFGGSTATLGWGFVRGRHAFETIEIAVPIVGLPRTLDGYVIAQISDIHAGSFVGETELAEGFALVRGARADLIVVTGDLVDLDPGFAPLVARRLADLQARDGVVVALGNHDYYAGRDQVLAALRRAGVDALVDRGRVIRPGDAGGFALLGVDDLASPRWGGSGPNLDRALSTIPPHVPRVLLSHQPQSIDEWAGRINLQLSGHTHGGQINPGFRPADLIFPYVAGTYRVSGTTLYVNRGFGTVGLPARVMAPPEVTRIVLVAA